MLVWVVEDQREVLNGVAALIEGRVAGAQVAGRFARGAEAVEAIARGERFDVALVDLGLPGIDGFEVARRIRAAADGASLYLVALTGYGGADDAVRAQSAGFDRHLIKPTSVEELARVVSFQKP